MLTPKQGWALAHLIHELREDWDAEGIVAALKKCANKPAPLVALAAIRAAADPNTRNPGVIPSDGTHWSERLAPQENRPPRKTEDCPKHPGNWAGTCPGCAADAHVGDDSTYNPRREGAGPRAEHVRAALLEAKARTCACGVDRLACPEHRNPSTQETEPTEEVEIA